MKKSFAPVLISVGLTLLAACGKDGGGSNGNASTINPGIQEQQAEGSYRAILRPFNNSLSGFLPTGAAEVTIAGDSVAFKTYLDDDAKVSHMQNIHTGTRCPDISDDRNGDGLIDVQEATAAAGEILVPLDADVNSTVDGEGLYPLGGGFTYNEQASLSKLSADVLARTNQNLNLSGRVVLIHGVASNTIMPATVATKNSMTTQSSVPIACGIIQRR